MESNRLRQDGGVLRRAGSSRALVMTVIAVVIGSCGTDPSTDLVSSAVTEVVTSTSTAMTTLAAASPTIALPGEPWDAECQQVFDDALAVVEAMVRFAEDLSIDDAIAGPAFPGELVVRSNDVNERFRGLGCSQFYWDIRMIERIDTVPAVSGAAFVIKARAAEAPAFHITWEYREAVDDVVQPNTQPRPLPPLDFPEIYDSCEEVNEGLLQLLSVTIAAEEYRSGYLEDPQVPGLDPDRVGEEFAAIESSFALLECDPVERARFLIEHHADLTVQGFYTSLAKYGLFENVIDDIALSSP